MFIKKIYWTVFAGMTYSKLTRMNILDSMSYAWSECHNDGWSDSLPPALYAETDVLINWQS